MTATRGERILIVDDNTVNLRLVSFLLHRSGYDVQTAADADEALAVLQVFTPKLILMDIQLPGIDGLELTRRLKADPVVLHVPTSIGGRGHEDVLRFYREFFVDALPPDCALCNVYEHEVAMAEWILKGVAQAIRMFVYTSSLLRVDGQSMPRDSQS